MGFLKRALGSVGGTVEGLTPFPDLQRFATERGLAFLVSGQVFGTRSRPVVRRSATIRRR